MQAELMSTFASRSNHHYDAARIEHSGYRCDGAIQLMIFDKTSTTTQFTENEVVMGGGVFL
ncbi:hypothetical protein C5O25_02575 [Paramuribaculum intestinale]|uniref:Uncharacterized protein n=1 Tax=Paramuribaculum intestinale TaxID=2094151 RepID=A0A2V1IVX1_9BACT|nr:hypothetical protein C5O25_02575 [Paramuribaculum intestinale]